MPMNPLAALGLIPGTLQAQLAQQAATNPAFAAILAGMKRQQPDGGFATGAAPKVPQRDGADDDEEEEGADGSGGEEKEQGEGGEQPADDEVLSSDSEEEEEDDGECDDFLCCQFEKVGRTKNRWKIAMREGVFHINGGCHGMHAGMPCIRILHARSNACSCDMAQPAESFDCGPVLSCASLALECHVPAPALIDSARVHVPCSGAGKDYLFKKAQGEWLF